MPLMEWFTTNYHKRQYYIASLPLGGPGWALQLPSNHIIHISDKRGFKGFISYPILNK